MLVHLEVALAHTVERYAGMVWQLAEHVVEKVQSGVDQCVAPTIEVDYHVNVGFGSGTLYFGTALCATQKFGYVGPIVGGKSQHVLLHRVEHGGSHFGLLQQYGTAPHVDGQLHIGGTVAYYIRVFQVVAVRHIRGEHGRARLACGRIVGGECAVYIFAGKGYALALECLQHFVVSGPEGVFGKTLGAEAVLVAYQQWQVVGLHHRAQSADGTWHKLEFLKRVNLLVGRLFYNSTISVNK